MLKKDRLLLNLLESLLRVCFSPLFFLSFPLHHAVDKIDFNIAERIAGTKNPLFSGCTKALTANPTTLAMLPC